ncbi:MAG: hypothetical protein WA125_16605 [Desulfosporosinus sp.]
MANKPYKEWIEITTCDDAAKGLRVYREKYTGETMRVNVDGSGCLYEEVR